MLSRPLQSVNASQNMHLRVSRGFVIIASLVLMILIALIAVGLMALVSSRNRIASHKLLVAEARQQALIGLDDAIAVLQMELGVDQRVSANSGILNDSQNEGSAHLLGVWDSWTASLYGSPEGLSIDNIQSSYDRGRSKMFRRWLISARKQEDVRRMEAYDDLSTRKQGERICLVGMGTLGNEATVNQYIFADLITTPSRANKETQFAWWVGGENQKAKINMHYEEAAEPLEALSRTWDTPPPSFAGSIRYPELDSDLGEHEKLLSLQSLSLANEASQGAGTPYFFDVSLHSRSLMTNVRSGGLKQDLSLLLNKPTLKGTEFARRGSQDAPLVEKDRDIPAGNQSNMPIGSWQVLHAYHNTYPTGQQKEGAFQARLQGSIQNPHTRMSGAAFAEDEYQLDTNAAKESNFDTKVLLEEGSETAGYARVPVLLSFIKSFFMVSEPVGQATGADQRYTFSLGYTPVVLWWNPYNVPMRVKGRHLWVHTIPYKTMWLQSFAKHNDGLPARWTNYCMMQPGVPDPNNMNGAVSYNNDQSFGEDYGQFFSLSRQAIEQDIVFEPGEILIFSPSEATALTDQKKPYSNPFINEYDPKMTSGYRAYLYSYHTEEGIKQDDKPLYLRLGTDIENVPASSSGVMGRDFSGAREAITYRNGYNGLYDWDSGDDKVGKYLNSPQRFSIAWYDSDVVKDNTDIMDKEAWNVHTQNDNNQPYYVAAVGITPKSANGHMRTRFATGDYRTKSWQHSNPAFFGSRLIKPDESMRTYHPYQVVTMRVTAGLGSAPVDSVGKNGFYGMTVDGEQVSFISSQEIAVHPPFSLAGYAGMRLTPGWFAHKGSFENTLARQQYQAGVPGVGIGNAFADPTLPADGVYVSHDLLYPEINGLESIFDDFYDHGLLINDALWDRFFTSSISDMPLANGVKKAQQTAEQFFSGTEALPVSRYSRIPTPYKDDSIVDRIMEDDGWKYLAQFLWIEGGFNVNSTSVEAWAATLRGLSRRKLLTSVEGRLGFVEEGKAESDVLFSRFMLSTTDKSIDSLGSYSMMRGSSTLRKGYDIATAWGEVRKLKVDEVDELAERIVEQVRERGPFLNMSDFINRRLDSSHAEHAKVGALQAAIDATDINFAMEDLQINSVPEGKLYRFPEAARGSLHTAAPGYLIQSDVLMSLGNILTVRDDTFTVRSYGCVRNKNGAVLAQAWCEAVVQRGIDYVDPTDAPYESQFHPDGSPAKELSKVNQVLGRQMKIVSFRWLDHWDI